MFKLSWFCLSYLGLTYVTGKYTLHTTSENCADARSICISLGTRLVKVNSHDILQEIVGLTYGRSREFWIGLTLDDTRPPTDSSYKYEDGEPANFFMWRIGEPNGQLTDQCIRASHKSGSLEYKTKDCSTRFDFVCERIDVITTDATTLDDSELTSSALSTSTAIEPSSSSSESPSTNIETSNFYSTSTDHTYRECVCEMSCTRGTTDSNVTSDRLEEIRSALIVDKKSLSSTKRKLISAGDDRQSSTLIGYAGAIFIAISVFFIVVGDIVNIMKWAFLKCKY